MNDQTASALADLLYADRALIEIYQDAASRIDGETIELLQSATDDHRRHEALLADALEDAEMQVVEPGEDMQRLLDEHRRHVHNANDPAQILDALQLAEQLSAMLYESAQRAELPEELADILAGQHADERLHASLVAEAPRPEGPRHDVGCMTGGFTDDINPDDFD